MAERLSALSKERRWDEMEAHITDEMVDTIAIVAPHDRLANAVGGRYGGICSRVEFSIAVESADDAERLRGMVEAIQSSDTSPEERAPWETKTEM